MENRRVKKRKRIRERIKVPPIRRHRNWLAFLLPLALGVIAFCVYLPSIWSSFVYDAHREILQEGYATNLANLPDVLTLRVLGMPLILSDRPGTILYLMLNAAMGGVNPRVYHASSDFLHAANVVLFYILLRRLLWTDIQRAGPANARVITLAMVAVTLLFAVHPVAVESVAEVSYCSTLLVAFFTLLALLAATYFRPKSRKRKMVLGAAVTVCAFAAVACKESGVTAALLLIVYWLMYRRDESLRAWLWFLGPPVVATLAFLTARFVLAPPGGVPTAYLGGSFAHMLFLQPRLWVFMIGKIVWPLDLSADYTLADLGAPGTVFSILLLLVVIGLQVWLVRSSRIGAFGVAVYWLGLATVSNFIPLYRIVADRYYYLALVGIAMQVMAGLLILLEKRRGFWPVLVTCFLALGPLTYLTVERQAVFADDTTLWTDTLNVSPHSKVARLGLGWSYFQQGQMSDAIDEFRKGLEDDPNAPELHYNLGAALAKASKSEDAMAEFQRALDLRPTYADARYNLGNTYFDLGKLDDAMAQYREAIKINPRYYTAYKNLGVALLQANRVDEAIVEYQHAVEVKPQSSEAHDDLGLAYAQKGELDQAVAEFAVAVQLDPNNLGAYNNLSRAQALLKSRK